MRRCGQVRYTDHLIENVKGLTIGVPKEYFGEGTDKRVEKAVWDAIMKLNKLGADYKEVSLPHTKYALSAYYIIAMCEASSNLARFDGLRYGLQGGQGRELAHDVLAGSGQKASAKRSSAASCWAPMRYPKATMADTI